MIIKAANNGSGIAVTLGKRRLMFVAGNPVAIEVDGKAYGACDMDRKEHSLCRQAGFRVINGMSRSSLREKIQQEFNERE